MTKTFAFFISTVALLGSLKSHAGNESPYSRGIVLAVDTRDRSQCDLAQRTIQGMTKSDVSQVCAQDGRNPFAVAIITVPISEFDYLSEVEPAFKTKPPLTAITNPQLGTMFILPRGKYTDQYFQMMARRDKASITIFRQADFGEMEFNKESTLRFSFVLKSNSDQNTSQKIAASVAKRLVFNRRSIDMSEAQYRSQANKAAGIKDAINGAIQDAISSDRASVDFFMPKNCQEPKHCPHTEGYGLGLTVTIRF